MSNASIRSNRNDPSTVRQFVLDRVRALAFWIAVGLLLAYVPVLYVSTELASLEPVLVLVFSHFTCVIVGHGHTPRRRSR